MAGLAASLQWQQLLELLALVTSRRDEDAAIRDAVERTAQALEAEVAAVVLDGRVAAVVGFPATAVPLADLLAVGRREQDWLDVPGLDRCQAIAVPWDGSRPGQLIMARGGDTRFSVEEQHLVRGMARTLELTLTMLRTLQAEHEAREESERQAEENARLLYSLQEQQRMLLHLSTIQRAIARRDPLAQILQTIITALQELLGDEVVALWIRNRDAPDHAKLLSAVGLSAMTQPTVPLVEAGAVGAAMRGNDVVKGHGNEHLAPAIGRLTTDRLYASMAAPVHESGEVSGGLLVASYRPDRFYSTADAEMLRTFAQNVSLALTDAHTFSRMNEAVHDALTGLASRGLFLERMADELAQSRDAALLFVDLDRFKQVNDTLGHAAGDELLTVTAQRVQTQLRPTDIAGRFGGDEFAILLCGTNDTGEVAAIAEQIHQALAEPMVVTGRSLSVHASTGIALCSAGSPDATELMRRADIAMYQAKRKGRGRYEIFTKEMQAALTEAPNVTGQ